MTYRIMTEDKNRKDIIAILKRRFNAFTLIPSLGYWNGEEEKSLIIEVEVSDPSPASEVAEEIKVFNHQDAVLVTQIETVAQFV